MLDSLNNFCPCNLELLGSDVVLRLCDNAPGNFLPGYVGDFMNG
jgi:hypothetical protein